MAHRKVWALVHTLLLLSPVLRCGATLAQLDVRAHAPAAAPTPLFASTSWANASQVSGTSGLTTSSALAVWVESAVGLPGMPAYRCARKSRTRRVSSAAAWASYDGRLESAK